MRQSAVRERRTTFTVFAPTARADRTRRCGPCRLGREMLDDRVVGEDEVPRRDGNPVAPARIGVDSERHGERRRLRVRRAGHELRPERGVGCEGERRLQDFLQEAGCERRTPRRAGLEARRLPATPTTTVPPRFGVCSGEPAAGATATTAQTRPAAARATGVSRRISSLDLMDRPPLRDLPHETSTAPCCRTQAPRPRPEPAPSPTRALRPPPAVAARCRRAIVATTSFVSGSMRATLRPSEFATQTAPSPKATSTGPSPTGIVRRAWVSGRVRGSGSRVTVSSPKLATQSESVPTAIAAGTVTDADRAQLLDGDGIDLDDRVGVAVDDPERLEPEGDVRERGEHGARGPVMRPAWSRLPCPGFVRMSKRPSAGDSQTNQTAAGADRDARPRRPAARACPLRERKMGDAASFELRVDADELGRGVPRATETVPAPTATSLG